MALGGATEDLHFPKVLTLPSRVRNALIVAEHSWGKRGRRGAFLRHFSKLTSFTRFMNITTRTFGNWFALYYLNCFEHRYADLFM
jgi:hypothetical protein